MARLWHDLQAQRLLWAKPQSWKDYIRVVGPRVGNPDLRLDEATGLVCRFETPGAIVSAELRWTILERDNFTCRSCGSRRFLQVDHVYPQSRGGPGTHWNLQTLCRSCNTSKRDRVVR